MGVSSTAQVGFLHRLNAFRERFGAKNAIYKAVDVVLQKVFRTSTHTVVWLDVDAVKDMKCTDPQFTFRFLTGDEIENFAKDPTFYINPGLADGVPTGAKCASRLWRASGWPRSVATRSAMCRPRAAGAAMSFPNDVAYMSFGYTHPDFRGARLHGLIMGLALQELAKRGITKLVSLVSWTNHSSLKSCWRLGYIGLGNMVTIGSPKRAIGFYPQAAKDRGVRFGRNALRLMRPNVSPNVT